MRRDRHQPAARRFIDTSSSSVTFATTRVSTAETFGMALFSSATRNGARLKRGEHVGESLLLVVGVAVR
jgi:hypothetical protein